MVGYHFKFNGLMTEKLYSDVGSLCQSIRAARRTERFEIFS